MKTMILMFALAGGLAAQSATPPPTPPKTVPIPREFAAEIQALGARYTALTETQGGEMAALKSKHANEQKILDQDKAIIELRIRMEVGMKDGQVDWQSGTVREAPKPPAAAPTPPVDPKKK